MAQATEYRVTSAHAEDLASGQQAVPGEVVRLDDEAQKADHNKRLIDEGKLTELREVDPPQPAKATKAKGNTKSEGGGS